MPRFDPDLNMDRFYSVELTYDLFGEHGVHRQWVRIDSWGRYRRDWCDTELEAESAMTKLTKEKLAGGYLLKTTPTRI